MRSYRRLLGYLKPYRGRLAAAILCMILLAASAGLTMGLISPFVQVLFTPQAAPASGPAGPAAESPPAPAPTPGLAAPPSGTTSGPPSGTTSGPPSGTTSAPRSAGEAVSRAWGTTGWGHLDRWPGFLKGALDRFIFHGSPLERLARICLLIVVAFFLKNLFDYLQSFLMVSVEQAVVRDLRNDLYAHLHRLPLAFFHGERTGLLASRVINDVQYVRGALAAGISNLIKDSLVLSVALFWVFWASWRLALVSLIILPPCLGLVIWIGRRMRRRSEIMQERMADLQAVLHETLANIRVVKAFHAERFEQARFAEENQRFFRSFVRLRRVGAAAGPLAEYAMVVIASGVLWYGGQQIFGGSLEPQNFFVFVVALLSMMSPLKSLSNVNSTVQEGLAAAGRIFALLDTPSTVAERPGARPVRSFEDRVRFERVSFAYGRGENALADVNFELRRGETVALVGPSGAGKSTLADLLPRFYDPTAGRITLDGVDLRELALDDLRRLFGIVSQETILFHGSVYRNIAYGRDDADRGRVEAAARAANAHDFVTRLPDGYDTPIGERGVKLSGGERQRLALARAMLKDPAILILDEATSSLDSESERLVQEAVERLRAGRTALIIAHRLSTVTHADRIVVLERGRIVETGRHRELLERDGLYRRLHTLQFQA